MKNYGSTSYTWMGFSRPRKVTAPMRCVLNLSTMAGLISTRVSFLGLATFEGLSVFLVFDDLIGFFGLLIGCNPVFPAM